MMRTENTQKYIVVWSDERDLNISSRLLGDKNEAIKAMCDKFVDHLDDIDGFWHVNDVVGEEFTSDVMYSMLDDDGLGDGEYESEDFGFAMSGASDGMIASGWCDLHNQNFDIAVFTVNE